MTMAQRTCVLAAGLLLSALLAAPGGAAEASLNEGPTAELPSAAACRADLDLYRAAPSVALLDRLLPCLDVPEPKLRALILDKIVCREIWSDPTFKTEAYPRLRKVSARFARDPDWEVSKFAFDIDWWLDNWSREVDPDVLAERRRREEIHQRRMERSELSIKIRLVELGIIVFVYLISLVRLTAQSRLRRIEERLKRAAVSPRPPDAPPSPPPGTKVL
ncbi:MAG: hypothetical protein HY077_00885 [Elusimicrobia bacterium]|nr:hypothetical protein [Elusimicrobiota bacterium]